MIFRRQISVDDSRCENHRGMIHAVYIIRLSLVILCFILLCFCLHAFSLKPRPFVQSFFGMQARDLLTTTTLHVFLAFFRFGLFGDVAFHEYFFCTVVVFSLYGEYVVRFLFFPSGCLLTTGWIFYTSLL